MVLSMMKSISYSHSTPSGLEYKFSSFTTNFIRGYLHLIPSGFCVYPCLLGLMHRFSLYTKNFIRGYLIPSGLTRKLVNHEFLDVLSSVNSYLGILKHYDTYRLRKSMLLNKLSAYYYNLLCISGNYGKMVQKVKIVKHKTVIS